MPETRLLPVVEGAGATHEASWVQQTASVTAKSLQNVDRCACSRTLFYDLAQNGGRQGEVMSLVWLVPVQVWLVPLASHVWDGDGPSALADAPAARPRSPASRPTVAAYSLTPRASGDSWDARG